MREETFPDLKRCRIYEFFEGPGGAKYTLPEGTSLEILERIALETGPEKLAGFLEKLLKKKKAFLSEVRPLIERIYEWMPEELRQEFFWQVDLRIREMVDVDT